MTGVEHITTAFEEARLQGRAALMPYFTLGYPNPAVSLDILQAVAESGADMFELGVPFSDPLADGPVIQRSTQIALGQGVTLKSCFEMAAELRRRSISQPLLLMSYFNPVLSYGVRRSAAAACAAGADGFILPDLPPEEADDMEAACRDYGLALVYLLAPTSTPERIALITSRSTGFVYLVSLTGVTGARQGLPPGLADFVGRVRRQTTLPLAVGFGISTPEHVKSVGELADGVIVGSALIQAVAQAQEPVAAAAGFLEKLGSSA